MFQVGQLSAWEVIHSRPFHHNILDFKSITDSSLVGMSAGLSFVVIYLKTMFGSDLISSMQFLSKTESDLLVLTQFSAHCEYPYYFFFDL